MLTCTNPTKLRSHQQSAGDLQTQKARWGTLDKGVPQIPFPTSLCHPVLCWEGGFLQLPQGPGTLKLSSLRSGVGWGLSGETELPVFLSLPFITRKNNKIETFVWKMQWRSDRERGGEAVGQGNSPIQGGKGSRLPQPLPHKGFGPWIWGPRAVGAV